MQTQGPQKSDVKKGFYGFNVFSNAIKASFLIVFSTVLIMTLPIFPRQKNRFLKFIVYLFGQKESRRGSLFFVDIRRSGV